MILTCWGHGLGNSRIKVLTHAWRKAAAEDQVLGSWVDLLELIDAAPHFDVRQLRAGKPNGIAAPWTLREL